jgi:hypothetical protein
VTIVGGPLARDGGEALHHLPVGQHIGAPELDLVGHLLEVGERVEGLDDVADGHGLRAGVDPLRGEHRGSRRTRWESISNDAEPWPRIIAART